ncbi:apolipoprotein N-acyltransferase [Ignavibacteria bacterium]|nr:apolipoprotein N-acyltransferase [Bacteroidota bacterium]MCZ2133469.1 apolipoprotein N-acyltransferase [Bacteroidota bacterium]
MAPRLLWAVSAGLLLGFSFPPLHLGALAFAGFLPLLLALDGLDGKFRRLCILYAAFFCFCGAGNWWVLSWQKNTDPYLILSGAALWIGHPFFFMLPFAAYRAVEKRIGRTTALLSLPVFWTSFEWLHSLSDASYPWLSLGYSQIYNLAVAQSADIGGVWILSFLILLVNILIALPIFRYLELRGKMEFASVFRMIFRSREALFIAIILIVAEIYGLRRISEVERSTITAPKIEAAIVQPNIDPWKKWEGGVFDQVALHKRLADSLRRVRRYDLCVWSETSIPYLGMARSTPEGLGFLQAWTDSSDAALLTGFSEFALYSKATAPPTARPLPFDSSTYFGAYNAAALLPVGAASGKQRPTHRKMKLTPFAERIPFVEYFPIAKKWLEWGVGISDWQKGETQKTLNFQSKNKSVRIGCIICIESVYPDFVRNYTAEGANILAVITNDAWYNYTFGPEQHYQIAAMRAIENRRGIIRAANSGMSGFISPTGASIYRAEPYKSLAAAASVPLISTQTIYSRFGDWLPKLLTLISVGIITYAILSHKFRKSTR